MPSGRVLVTGAGGFIGGRVVEVLHTLRPGSVRAAVRRWSSAARIGRLPIEIVQCDVMDATSVRGAMSGVGAVVHCARGDPIVNVEGTRVVLGEAQRAGISRAVHLSSVAVYGSQQGEVSEETPCAPGSSPYGRSKHQAEEICWEYSRAGLAVAVLRPTIVYGPFSNLWTVEFAHRMAAGTWYLPDEYCRGTCNLVYVDDVVRAVLLALDDDRALGQAFNVNGSGRPAWSEYFHALNDALGLPPLRQASVLTSRLKAGLMMPVRKTAKVVLRRFQPLVLALYQRSSAAKAVMRRAEAVIRNAPTSAEFDLYSLAVSYGTEKAQKLLGYQPVYSMRDGIELSVAWLKHNRYVQVH